MTSEFLEALYVRGEMLHLLLWCLDAAASLVPEKPLYTTYKMCDMVPRVSTGLTVCHSALFEVLCIFALFTSRS